MPDYPQVDSIGGMFAGLVQGQQFKDAQAAAEQARQKSLQDYLFAEQENPLKIQQAQANIPHTQALTRQANATTDATEFQTKWKKRTEDREYQKLVDEQAKVMDEASLSKTMRQAQEDLWSGDPERAKRGQFIFDHTQDILTKKAQWAAEKDKATSVARIGQEGANARATAAKSGDPKTLQADFVKWRRLSQDMSIPEADRQQAALMANDTWTQIQALANAKVPTVVVTDGRVGTNPNVPKGAPVVARGASAPAAAKPEPTVVRTGMSKGRKVAEMSDGTIKYVD